MRCVTPATSGTSGSLPVCLAGHNSMFHNHNKYHLNKPIHGKCTSADCAAAHKLVNNRLQVDLLKIVFVKVEYSNVI